MLSSPILLDYQSSTPCLQEVVESMNPYWKESFANPSNKTNTAGISASALLEFSREKIQNFLKLKNKKLIFTSGATESNNLALIGYARNFYQNTGTLGNIVTLTTEHHAVLEPLKQLEREGFHITRLNPEKDGLISEEKFINALNDKTILVSVMMANNEIGVIQPIRRIYEICKKRNIILHTDAAQCPGYLSLKELGLQTNMATLSGHKIYGPKGVGLLIIDNYIQIKPILFGGDQEFGLRSGTSALPLIIGFTKALELATKNQKENSANLEVLRNKLYQGIIDNNSDILLNGSMEHRLPHNLNITIPFISGSLLHKKIKSQIICSSGSACSNGRPSHVLQSIGRTFKESEASLRLSIGLMTTNDDINTAISSISKIIKDLRK